jgi:hypothetical protein
MNMPDRNPKLPKNNKEAERKLIQQPRIPRIPRETLNEIFAGVSSLPALRVIGEKLNPPKIDDSKSNEMQQKSDKLSQDYDKLIAKNKNLAEFHKRVQGRDYEAKVLDLESSAGNFEYTKEFHAKAASDQIQTQKQTELENFERQYPEHVERKVQNETNKNLKSLKDQYKSTQDDVQREIIKSQIDAVNKSNSTQMDKLAKYKAENEKQKIEAKSKSQAEKSALKSQKEIDKIDERNEKAKEQQKLDDSIKTQFEATMAHNSEVNRRAKNIQSIREERKSNEKQISKAQKEGKKLTNKADQRLQNIENKEMREAEADKELKHRAAYLESKRVGDESKIVSKDHVSIFQKLKGSVETASKKGFEFVKRKIKENDENLTTERFDPKTGERISSVIDFGSVIKNAEKTIEKGVKKAIKETKKSRDKIVKSVEEGVEDLINKRNEEKDRITSPEMIEIKNEIDKNKQELKILLDIYKKTMDDSVEMKALNAKYEDYSKSIRTEKNPEFRDADILTMDAIQKQIIDLELKLKGPRIPELKNKIIKLTKDLKVQIENDEIEYNDLTPTKQNKIDNLNIATNQLIRLKKDFDIYTDRLAAKIVDLEDKKPIDTKRVDKLFKEGDKKEKEFDIKVKKLETIIKNNEIKK